MISPYEVLVIAAGLMSDDGENPEYDRACVEITRDVMGLGGEQRTRESLEETMRAINRIRS